MGRECQRRGNGTNGTDRTDGPRLDRSEVFDFGGRMKNWMSFLAGLCVAASTVAADGLDKEKAAAFVQLALKGIDREYPNKPGEVLRGPQDIMSPRAMHPAFKCHWRW